MMSTPVDRWLEELVAAKPTFLTPQRPLVTLTYAQSLDGSIALENGQPLGLSGRESLVLTHRLRAAHDAIMVGIGTVLHDDPRLTVRLVAGPQPQPVILDSHLRTPLQARIWEHPKKPWIVACSGYPPESEEALLRAGARILPLSAEPQKRIPLPDLLSLLFASGIQRLMVEGGAEVITSFLSQGLVDWVLLTLAPVFLGGKTAVVQPVSSSLVNVQTQCLGDDIIVWGRYK